MVRSINDDPTEKTAVALISIMGCFGYLIYLALIVAVIFFIVKASLYFFGH